MGATALIMYVSPTWRARLALPLRALMPLQDGLSTAADAATQQPSVTTEVEALRRQVAALTVMLEDLREEYDKVTATRRLNLEGGSLGLTGKLVPARVIASDVAAWRTSKLVDTGGGEGIHPGDAVTSRTITLNRGADSGVQSGVAVLLGETLVGFASATDAVTARVRLLSDAGMQMRVRIGRFVEGEFYPYPADFWMIGRGDGRMEIADVPGRDLDAGRIDVGDLVLSTPLEGVLPAAMVVGRVVNIRGDVDNPLLGILTVEPAADETALRRVYVYVQGEAP